MKTKDLFAGHFVTLMPHDDVWLVGLSNDNDQLVSMQTYHELPHAIGAVHEWGRLLSDETEIHPSIEAAVDLMRQTLARRTLDEGQTLPATMEDLDARDELRTWYEREMEDSGP